MRRELWLLESANVLGGVGNALVMVVIPWLILERTGSPAVAGLAAALSALPGIVMAPLVGVLVDRVGRTAVAVGSDLASAVSVVLFPLLDSLGLLAIGVILALTVVGAALDPAGYTARKTLIPDVATASGAARDQVNGLHEGLFMGGWVVGPMVGALGIATVGSVTTMGLASVAFVLAALAVQLLGVPNRADLSAAEMEVASPWHSVRAGLAVLLADRPVWVLTVVVAVLWMIYMPTESVLLPTHFEAAEKPAAFGLVVSAMSAGGMVGAFGYGWLARRATRHRLAVACIALATVAYVPIALLPPPALMVVPGLLLGLAWGPMEPLLNSLVQDRFPVSQHGRIYGVQLAIFYAAPPLGQLVAGLSADAFGVPAVMLGIAAGLVAVAAVVASLPSLRGLDEVRSGAGA